MYNNRPDPFLRRPGEQQPAEPRLSAAPQPPQQGRVQDLSFWRADDVDQMDHPQHHRGYGLDQDDDRFLAALRQNAWKYIMAVVGLGLAIAAAIFSYRWLKVYYVAGPIVVTAPEGPYKVKPADPGGVQVPYQDREVYNRIASNKNGDLQPGVERLLPEVETPVDRDAAPGLVDKNDIVVTTKDGPAVAKTTEDLQLTDPFAAAKETEVEFTVQGQKIGAEATPVPVKSQEPAPARSTVVAPAPPPASTLDTLVHSVNKPTAAGGPAQPQAVAVEGPRVQLAAVKTSAEADQELKRIKRVMPGAISGVTVKKVKGPVGKGQGYRLVATGFADATSAQKFCKKSKELGVKCMLIK